MNFSNIDLLLLKLINQPFLIYLNIFFMVVVFSVYAYIFFLFFILYRRKQRRASFHLLLTCLIGFATVTIIKHITAVPRPEFNPILRRVDPSFPSRHSFAAGLGLYFTYKTFDKLIRALTTIYLLLIPFGSVYLGVHYPSDVMVGLAIGLLVPKIISQKVSTKLENKLIAFISKRS